MLLLGQLSTRSKVGNLQVLPLLLTLLLMLPPLDLMFTGGYGVASPTSFMRGRPRGANGGGVCCWRPQDHLTLPIEPQGTGRNVH
jgi:hypothetical protein